jgi:GT2 family glycosyltransferase
MEKTLISVIIPTYKSPEMLDLCLRSCIEGQVDKNQIIVVVDGFYDINKEVLEKYAKSIEILTLDDNVGLCRGTNLGVYNAKYERILIVNDDNVFPQHWDKILNYDFKLNSVISPNQVEPTPSMFSQFIIEDLGRDVKTFDLDKFWQFDYHVASGDKIDETGSTLPIFMSKVDYLRVGGWDENYQDGMVADWDFFLKCQLSGLKMLRTYNSHFYHFASVSVNGDKRRNAEVQGHEYAKYKWGSYIKHNPTNNLKFL